MASSTDTRREPDKGTKASPLEGTKLAPARRVPTWVAWVVGLILLALGVTDIWIGRWLFI